MYDKFIFQWLSINKIIFLFIIYAAVNRFSKVGCTVITYKQLYVMI